MELTSELLQKIMPHAEETDDWALYLNDACQRFDINTPTRMAAFLANVAEETGQLSRLTENLNYSAERLLKVYPSKFKTLEQAQEVEHNPEAIANITMGGKYGNEPNTNDGFLYRGRGCIQLTFKDNYKIVGNAIDEDLVSCPEMLENKKYAALSGAGFWHVKNINIQADKEDIRACRKIINSACLGIDNIQKMYIKALDILKNA